MTKQNNRRDLVIVLTNVAAMLASLVIGLLASTEFVLSLLPDPDAPPPLWGAIAIIAYVCVMGTLFIYLGNFIFLLVMKPFFSREEVLEALAVFPLTKFDIWFISLVYPDKE